MAEFTLVRTNEDGWLLSLAGDCEIRDVQGLYDALAESLLVSGPVQVDLSDLSSADTAVVQLLLSLKRHVETVGSTFEWRGLSDATQSLFHHLGVASPAVESSR